MPSRLLATEADAVLIVNPAVVVDHALGIKQECFRRPLGPECIRRLMFNVAEDWKRHVAFLSVCGHSDKRVLAIGVDAEELHASVCILLIQVDQRRDVKVGKWAFGIEKHYDKCPLVFESIERAWSAVNVLQD